MPPSSDPVPGPRVEVRRSARRRRSVSAYRNGDLVVVRMRAAMSVAAVQYWVAEMLRRLERGTRRRRAPRSDADLLARCHELAAAHLGGRVRPRTVRWVPVMRTRWASCTPT